MLHLENTEETRETVSYLKKSISLNRKMHMPGIYYRAYAQINLIPLANYATASIFNWDENYHMNFAAKALKHIEENSPKWYRSKDLIEILKRKFLIIGIRN